MPNKMTISIYNYTICVAYLHGVNRNYKQCSEVCSTLARSKKVHFRPLEDSMNGVDMDGWFKERLDLCVKQT